MLFVVSDIFSAAGLPDDLVGLDVIEREQTELRITTDSRRYGKLMTLVHGFDGDKAEGKKLLSKLKSKCACGGAIKDGVIELQGSHVPKVKVILEADGYMVRADQREALTSGSLRQLVKRKVPRLEGLAKRLGKGELIGLPAKVANANDVGLVGLQGVVVDETLKTLTLDVDGRAIQLAKAGTIWSFQMSKGDWVEIDGRAIGFRPEDRGKKVK